MQDPTARAVDDALVVERFQLIASYMPGLYMTVALLVCVLGYLTRGVASPLFVFSWMALLLVGATIRGLHWWNIRKTSGDISVAAMRRELARTNYIGVFLCAVFAAIGYAVIKADSLLLQLAIMMIVWGATVGTAFYLFVLPVAARTVLISTTATASFVFAHSDERILWAAIPALVAMTAALMHQLHRTYENFKAVVRSKVVIDKMRQNATTMAVTDALTGLPNRRLFEQRLQICVAARRSFAVAMIDLDGFKAINDIYGHGVGDLFLTQAAQRFGTVFRAAGLLARMGGDEFALLVEEFATQEEVVAISQELINSLATPFVSGAIVASMSGSCGVAFRHVDAEADRLVERADLALYEAKAKARGQVVVFSDSLERDAQRRARMEQWLRAAIVNDELSAAYQPIVDMRTGELCGFEALARWRHPELGQVPPTDFIRIAEQAGLIERLTDNLLRKAARAAAAWPSPLKLSFNLSPAQLERPNAGLALLRILMESGFPPSRLEIEVTETTLMADVGAAAAVINDLKEAGARIALDDFGAGYSSFGQLCDLPLDRLKIDKSFVEKMCADQRAANVVRAIIKMCAALDLECVAEGIEREEQMILLRDLGCHKGQGYLFSPPLEQEDLSRLIVQSSAGKGDASLAPARRGVADACA
jgi:diguanylate cyclase (GGDEF)-like protein